MNTQYYDSYGGGSSAYLAIFVIAGLAWIIAGPVIGYLIGKPKDRGALGALLGFFLGMIGWLIVAILEPPSAAHHLATTSGRQVTPPPFQTTRPCPYCAEQIQQAAIVCRFCGRDVAPVVPPPDVIGMERRAALDHIAATRPQLAHELERAIQQVNDNDNVDGQVVSLAAELTSSGSKPSEAVRAAIRELHPR